jgi:putative SOS response-associated peptidase YedK
MPLILALEDYTRWLGDEPAPYDVMQPYPAESTHVRLISAQVSGRE